MIREIKASQFGVKFKRRGLDDPHIIIQLLSEDDESWSETGTGFSSFWIDDIISVLQSAKTIMQEQAEKDPSNFGYRFKDNG